MSRLFKILFLLCTCGLLTSCVTAIDDSLPQPKLHEITLAAQVNLAASPSHPTSHLPLNPIPAGANVELIATDNNSAWWLVAYQDKIGWIPTFFLQMGTSRVEPSITVSHLMARVRSMWVRPWRLMKPG